VSTCSSVNRNSRSPLSVVLLPILLFLSFPFLLLTYFGVSTIPTFAFFFALPLLLALRIPSFISQLRNKTYSRVFLFTLSISVLYVVASSFSLGSLKEVSVFIFSNLVAGSLLGNDVRVSNDRFVSVLFIGFFFTSLLSLVIFLSLAQHHHFISGIINIDDGNNDLYQTFGAYFLRSSLLPFASFFVSPQCLPGNRNKFLSYYPVLLFFGLSIGLYLLFVLGAKKDLFLVFVLWSISFHSLVPPRFRILLIPVLATGSVYLFSTLFTSDLFQEVYDYTVKRFTFSLDTRYGNSIYDTFLKHLSASFPFGDPYVHVRFQENYIHSSLLSAFISTGFLGGLLFMLVLSSFLFVLPKIPLCVAFPALLVVVISIIASTFSWLLFWFIFGFSFAFAISPAAVSCQRPWKWFNCKGT